MTLNKICAACAEDGESAQVKSEPCWISSEAEASSLPTILQRLKAAGLEAVPWSAGGACYPQTAGSADQLVEQALEMTARAKQDGGRRFYIPTTTS